MCGENIKQKNTNNRQMVINKKKTNKAQIKLMHIHFCMIRRRYEHATEGDGILKMKLSLVGPPKRFEF